MSCIGRFLRPGFYETHDKPGRTYFEKAFGKTEQALVHPTDSYGFIATDTISRAKMGMAGGPLKPSDLIDKVTFRTSKGKVYFRFEQVGLGPNAASQSWTMVCGGEGGAWEKAEAAWGTHTLIRNATGGGLRIGGSNGSRECYEYDVSKSKRDGAPAKQPCQILMNPCYAPLEIDPARLRSYLPRALPDEQGNRVYEVRWNEDGVDHIVRLHFSPEHGDAVAKSEREGTFTDKAGEVHKERRVVRTVEEWQTLSDGTFVPARFKVQREWKGQVELVLVREITNPVIGAIDDATFSTASLPEFNVKWDRVADGRKSIGYYDYAPAHKSGQH